MDFEGFKQAGEILLVFVGMAIAILVAAAFVVGMLS